ncbi:MAG: hypothetical protein ACYC7E_09345 [Armatimonadota bacterium]
MRATGIFCALAIGCLLWSGCGGGDGSQQQTPGDTAVVGHWLDIAPDAARAQPDACGYWHTRYLAFNADQTFRYEDVQPDNWASGNYSALQGIVTLSGLTSGGSPRFFYMNDVDYTIFNQQLILTDDPPAGSDTSQFSRVMTNPPSGMANEWLLAMRKNAEGGDLPCLESTRLVITPDSRVEMTHAVPASAQYYAQAGEFFYTLSGHAALRLPAGGGAPGNIFFLGACAQSGSTLVCQTPDGVQRVFAARVAPDARLLGSWTLQSTGSAGTLTIHSDGSYTLQQDAVTTSGAWRTYYGSYLCLLNSAGQSAYAWHYWGQEPAISLSLAAWVMDGDTPVYQQTFWKQQP